MCIHSQKTHFSIVRYGNVIGSRGSVVQVFNNIIKHKGKFLPITDKRMTRFWITLDDGVDFVLKSFSRMTGGEIYVPKIPSIKITDLAKAMSDKLKIKVVGIRAGEKLHEMMCPNETHNLTLEFKDHYVIFPSPDYFEKKMNYKKNIKGEKGKRVSSDFEYSSNKNNHFLSINQIKKLNQKVDDNF